MEGTPRVSAVRDQRPRDCHLPGHRRPTGTRVRLFGSGIRLFEGVDAGRIALEQIRIEPSPRVTHLTYSVSDR